MQKLKVFIVLLLLFPVALSSETGTVYLVLGSDTAIWDGMGTGTYHNTYNPALYTNPTQNARRVMDPSFRNQFVDSSGNTMKLTWWMMAGNIFRYATNTDMPVPNIMTLYFMKKYHGNNVELLGDELSLHYHTFVWTDYNNDGRYYWNQAKSFLESKDDWDYTLSQFLLEENTFPVSFRSGWHYMDNAWQQELNRVLPFSMHNDYPHVRIDETEPLDNLYDWSQAPSEFVPYQPSEENYQLPGGDRGWNVRSAHFHTTRYHNLMDTVFAAANTGEDQVACLWGHLPETDFLTNIEIIDSLAHQVSAEYPDVTFRYCTGIEAMQRWLGTSDTTAPAVTISEEQTGDDIYYRITTNEPLFQTTPFVAVKNRYEEYKRLESEVIGPQEWRTTTPVNANDIAKVGVAATDTVGNLATKFIKHLQDDLYIDNTDQTYQEIYGHWGNASSSTWGLSARIATVSPGDSAVAAWTPEITHDYMYGLFLQMPSVSVPASDVSFEVHSGNTITDTFDLGTPQYNDWNYLATTELSDVSPTEIRMIVRNPADSQESIQMSTDVLRVTPLVRERHLYLGESLIDFGEVSQDDTVRTELVIENHGYADLTVQNISAEHPSLAIRESYPITISPMGQSSISLELYHESIESLTDSIHIFSDDPRDPELVIPITANVQPFFTVTDNEDSTLYTEFGSWRTSVAQAYGPSSRYAWLNQSPRARATFTVHLGRTGIYEVLEIVPSTVNATDNAMYVIRVDGVPRDTVILNQNTGSGSWAPIGEYTFYTGQKVEVEVIDTGQSTVGDVLRADAIKLSLVEEITDVADNGLDIPGEFRLLQNYPNPFNATTAIPYHLAEQSDVLLEIYDIRGHRLRTLLKENQVPGAYTVQWDGTNDAGKIIGSGIYYVYLRAGSFRQSRKVLLIK